MLFMTTPIEVILFIASTMSFINALNKVGLGIIFSNPSNMLLNDKYKC